VYTKQEIIENRIKWAKYLIEKRLYKIEGRLQDNLKRCCLGHGCKVLNIEETGLDEYDFSISLAPESFIDKVGLNEANGVFDKTLFFNTKTRVVQTTPTANTVKIDSLTDLNDSTDATPKEIGLFILSKVKTDKNSPFVNSWNE
jgi:hypothetical protein